MRRVVWRNTDQWRLVVVVSYRTIDAAYIRGQETAAVAESTMRSSLAKATRGTSRHRCLRAGNLEAVAKSIREQLPMARIIIAADDDYGTERERGFNPGLRAAKSAAKAVGGLVVVPPFDRASGAEGDRLERLRRPARQSEAP